MRDVFLKGGIASSAPNGRYGSHHVVRNEKRSILDLEFQLMRGGIAVRYLDEKGIGTEYRIHEAVKS